MLKPNGFCAATGTSGPVWSMVLCIIRAEFEPWAGRDLQAFYFGAVGTPNGLEHLESGSILASLTVGFGWPLAGVRTHRLAMNGTGARDE